MDPKACLERILRAAEAGDKDEYNAACEDLAEWIRKGGFRIRASEIPRRMVSLRGYNGRPNLSKWCVWSPLVVPKATHPDMQQPAWTLCRYSPDGKRLLERLTISEPIL